MQSANKRSTCQCQAASRSLRYEMRAPQLPRLLTLGLVAVVLLGFQVGAKPTIYVKNDNDKLEPVLVPVSSTVIPLPVYKVGFSVGAAKGGERERPATGTGKPDEPIKLITVHHKKKASSVVTKDKVGAS